MTWAAGRLDAALTAAGLAVDLREHEPSDVEGVAVVVAEPGGPRVDALLAVIGVPSPDRAGGFVLAPVRGSDGRVPDGGEPTSPP